MSRRRFSRVLDAVAADRRAGSFRMDEEEAEILSAAIDLKAVRPASDPDEGFVAGLYEELAQQMAPEPVPIDGPARLRRGRVALVSVAAGVTLVAGTALATESFAPSSLTQAAVAPHGKDVRTGTFKAADNQVLGQVVAYRGRPSWVYMNVDVPRYNGTVMCHLQTADGSTVATGTFDVRAGTGEWSRTVDPDIGQVHGAKLIASDGSVLASATLS